jgi:hypothetical protein
MVVIMKNAIFWDVALVRTNILEERIASIIRVKRIGMLQLLITTNIVSSSLILFTLMMEVIRSSETPALTGATWRHIQEDGILQSQCLIIK